jgi:hypothetical protein
VFVIKQIIAGEQKASAGAFEKNMRSGEQYKCEEKLNK